MTPFSMPTVERLKIAAQQRGTTRRARRVLQHWHSWVVAAAVLIALTGMCHAACDVGGSGCEPGVVTSNPPLHRLGADTDGDAGGWGSKRREVADLQGHGPWSASRRLAAVPSCECGPGHACADDNSTCLACPVGSHKPAYTGTYTPTCAYGPASGCFFLGELGQRGCMACDRGSEARVEGSDACTQCQRGHYKSYAGIGLCNPCPAGTFGPSQGATNASQQCKTCPEHSTSTAGSSSASSCACFPQFYRSADVNGAMSCKRCPAGAMCRLDGFACSLNDDSFECPSPSGSAPIPGTWVRTGAGGAGPYELVSCPDGRSKVTTSHDEQACVACRRGTEYILRPDQDKCQVCPPGLVCNGTKSVAPVLEGSVWQADGAIMRLVSCPVGYQVKNSSSGAGSGGVFDASLQTCAPVAVCGAGLEYADGACVACGAGKFKSFASAATPCQDCPANTYRAESGGASVSDCHPCPAFSSTNNVTGAGFAGDCKCDERFYLVVGIGGQRSCASCPAGGLCPNSRVCALGRANMDCDGDGVTDVSGTWSLQSDGMYLLGGCPDGMMLSTSGASSLASTECVSCSSSRHYILRSGQDKCQVCPPGLVCNGTKSVAPVLEGSVWQADGAIMRLVSCPAGYFVSSGAVGGVFDASLQTCLQCGAGQDCPAGGCVSRCNDCSKGTYKDSTEASACTRCPKDTYSASAGASSASSCLPCPEGSITDYDGQTGVGACRCSGRFYRSSSPSEPVLCTYCPVAAMCGDGTCALNNKGHVCNDTGLSILGTWVQNTTDSSPFASLAGGPKDEWRFRLVSCPAGTSIVKAPPWMMQRCARCASAEYILDPSVHECQKCPPGLMCDGTNVTLPVVSGSAWSPLGMALKLTLCPAHHYIFEGNGSVLDPTVQECRPCGPGTECLAPPCFGRCLRCSAGTYKSSSYAEACAKCPPATFNPLTGSASVGDCQACFPGATTFESSGLKDDSECRCPFRLYKSGTAQAPVCSRCPVGAICAVDGSCAINNPQMRCPDGQAVGEWRLTGPEATAVLVSCSAGYTRQSTLSRPVSTPHDGQRCQQCTDGQYTTDPNNGKCTTCPAGLICNGGSFVISRLPGSVFTLQDGAFVLTKCPSGYRPYTSGGPDLQECQLCAAGQQCTGANCEACEACPIGTFKDLPGTSPCTPCPKNTYGIAAGAQLASSCQACASGTQTVSTGSTSVSACICFGRQYRAGNGVCVNCPVGGVCGDSTCALSFADKRCPGAAAPIVGSWVANGPGGSYNLLSCPAGYVGTFSPVALQQCMPCSLNEYQVPPDATCRRCPSFATCNGATATPSVAGSQMTLGRDGQYTLTSCPAYTILTTSTWGGVTTRQCSTCQAGSECTATPCLRCELCKAGYYKVSDGSVPCLECPANTFSGVAGRNTSCTRCSGEATTGGKTAQTSDAACVCGPRSLQRIGSDGRASCRPCPAQAICPDGACALSLGERGGTCSDGSQLPGTWDGPDANGDFFLTNCPAGYKYLSFATGAAASTPVPSPAPLGNSTRNATAIPAATPARAVKDAHATCVGCVRCPAGSDYCVQADYILDAKKYECQACPVGAVCNGAVLKTPPGMDSLSPAMVWKPDSAGRLWLQSCPRGHQLVNNTGYQNQECRPCPAGQSIARSDDPTLRCSSCPPGVVCNGGVSSAGPVFADTTHLELYVGGITTAALSRAGSASVAAMMQAISKSIGVDAGSVLVMEVCDSITLVCIEMTPGGGRRSMAEYAREGAYTALPRETDPFGSSRRVGYDGTDYCGDGGTYLRFNIRIPVGSGVDMNEVQQKMVDMSYSDQLGAEMQHAFEQAGEVAPCTQVVSSVVPGLSQGRIGWEYKVVCGNGTDYNVTNATIAGYDNFTSVVTYTGGECRTQLFGCPPGWLFINTTEDGRRCEECGRGTYSFDGNDGCVFDRLNGKFSCDERKCNPCPDNPAGGAICCGGKDFYEITENSVWDNTRFSWVDGHSSVVRRLVSCPAGFSLIRNDSDPTSDYCHLCPPFSFSLEKPDWASGKLVYPSLSAWELEMSTSKSPPCNKCPPGSTCFGGTDITPAEGYWPGEPMLCPPSACAGEPEVCDMLKCFPVSASGATVRSGARRSVPLAGYVQDESVRRQSEGVCGPDCRMRVYVHACPAGGCETNGTCAKGRTGPACGLCDVDHVNIGGTCTYCDASKNSELMGIAVAVFAPLLLSFFYFFSWKPLMMPARPMMSEEEAQPPSRLDVLAVHYKLFYYINEGWKGVKQSARETSFTPYIKTTISFYNIVGTYPTVFNIFWPDTLAAMMMVTNSLAGVDVLGLPGINCLAGSMSYTTKLLINTLTPIGINLVFFIAPVIVMVQGLVTRGSVKKHPNFKATLNRFCFTMCFTMGLYFPSVSIQVLSSFRCDHQLDLLIADYSERCPNGDPGGFIFKWSLLGALIYPVGIPMVMYWLMWFYSVPKIAHIKMNKALLKSFISLYQSVNLTQESEILVRIIGNVAGREQFRQRVHDLFLMIDKDGGGTLDIDELVDAFHVFGMHDVDEDRILKLLSKFQKGDDEEEIDPVLFLEIISEMTAISFLFNGHEEDLDELTIDQMRALCSFDWSRVTNKRKIREEDAENGEGRHGLFLADMDDPASMGPWILQKARDLRTQGHLAIPVVKWDGSIPGEQKAIDRMGVVFMEFKVEYWYYELFDMAKKITMTSVLSFVMYGTATQLFIGFMLLAASLLKILRSQPYASASLNTFQAYTYLVQCVTLLYGICIIADTDFDAAASKEFRNGWMSQVIIFVVGSVAFFPLAQALIASKWVRRVGVKIKKFLLGRVRSSRDFVFPSRVTKREAQSVKSELAKAEKRKDKLARFLGDGDGGGDEVDLLGNHVAGKGNGRARRNDGMIRPLQAPHIGRDAADPIMIEFRQDKQAREAREIKTVLDVEMVPNLNCGPGIFRMQELRARQEGTDMMGGISGEVEGGVGVDLVFTSHANVTGGSHGSLSGSESVNSGSSYESGSSEEESGPDDEASSSAPLRDLKPAPRLGPARVRNVDLDESQSNASGGPWQMTDSALSLNVVRGGPSVPAVASTRPANLVHAYQEDSGGSDYQSDDDHSFAKSGSFPLNMPSDGATYSQH